MRNRWFRSGAIIAIALVSAFFASHADARCRQRGLVLEIVTALDRPLPPDGAIVVALRPGARGTASSDPPTATIGDPGQAGGALVLSETIAPGLFRIPLASITPGRHTLRGITDREIAFTIASAAIAPLAAPSVRAIHVDHGGREGSPRATAELAARAPRGAVGIVIEVEGRAIGYAPIRDRARPSLVGFGHCDTWPGGASAPAVGAAITLRFVDVHGRLSPASAPIVATAS